MNRDLTLKSPRLIYFLKLDEKEITERLTSREIVT